MADVAKHYPHAISPVTIAWANLATCTALIYGPRVYMISKRKEQERATKKGPRPMPQPAPQPMPQAADHTGAAQPVPEHGRVFVMPIMGSIPGEVGAGM